MNTLITELEGLLDPARLRMSRFGSRAKFLNNSGLTYKHLHAFQERGQVSPSLFDALMEVAPETARPHLRQLYTVYTYERWLERPTTSTVDLLRRAQTRIDARNWAVHADYFTNAVRLLAEKSGISSARITAEDVGTILSKEVLSPREAGDYRAAMMNGMVLFNWWRNRLVRATKPSREQIAVASALLSGLARATGQVENLQLHRGLVRLADECSSSMTSANLPVGTQWT